MAPIIDGGPWDGVRAARSCFDKVSRVRTGVRTTRCEWDSDQVSLNYANDAWS